MYPDPPSLLLPLLSPADMEETVTAESTRVPDTSPSSGQRGTPWPLAAPFYRARSIFVAVRISGTLDA